MRFSMGFLKLEVSLPELTKSIEEFKSNRVKAFESLQEELRSTVSEALNQLLNVEMALFLGQPEEGSNKRNGFKTKEYVLKGVGCIQLRVPVDRKRKFESAIIPKRERVDPRLKEDLAALHLGGLSTRTLSMMSKRILGVEVSHQTVAESLPLLSDHARQWLERPIEGQWWALTVDGTYFSVSRRGSVEKEPMLVVLGIDSENKRSVLACEPGHRDNAESWRAVFRSLKSRGLDGRFVRVGVMDGLPGLERVFREEFPEAKTARCWFHAMQNALAKTPKRLKEPFHVMAKKIMYARDEGEARGAFQALKAAMGQDCARAVSCIEKDLDSLTSHYSFPEDVRRALKTTNAVERIHKEFKRRSRSMEGMSEMTLTTLVAFTALRLEMGWRRRGVDTYEAQLQHQGRRKLPVVDALESGSVIH
jgi:putative transposase